MTNEVKQEGLTLRHYKDAQFAQSACNSIALINSLHRMLPNIKQDIKDKTGSEYNTEAFNSHVIVRAFIGQLSFLAGESLGPSLDTLDELDNIVNMLEQANNQEVYS